MVEKKMNKNIAVLMGVTNDYVFAAANIVIALMQLCSVRINIVIAVENKNKLDKFERAAMLSIPQTMSINKFGGGVSRIQFIDVNELIPEATNLDGLKEFIKRWSMMPLAKLFMFKLFDDTFCKKIGLEESIDTCIWFDTDILVLDDIAPLLFRGPLSGAFGQYAEKILNKNILEELGLTGEEIKPNGGVLVVSKAILDICKYDKLEGIVLELLTRLTTKYKVLGVEEWCFVLLCQKLNIRMDILPEDWNYLPGYSTSFDPKVVHSLGKRKFWNDKTICTIFYQWACNNQKWLSLILQQGVEIKNISNFNHCHYGATVIMDTVNATYWFDFWNDFFNKNLISNQNVIRQFNPKSSYIQFYIKDCKISKNAHYELLYLKGKFYIAFHLEKKFQLGNYELTSWLKEFAKKQNADFEIDQDKISVTKAIDVGNVQTVFNFFVNNSVNEISKLIN